jgi:hypothetical protein
VTVAAQLTHGIEHLGISGVRPHRQLEVMVAEFLGEDPGLGTGNWPPS